MTQNEAYQAGFDQAFAAASFGQWHLTDAGVRYESGILTVHEAYDDLVGFAQAVARHAQKHAGWKTPGGKLRKVYDRGLLDGARMGAMVRLSLDEAGSGVWKDVDPETISVYRDIEKKIRRRREQHGMQSRVANLSPPARAAIGAGMGSAAGAFLGTLVGGGLGMAGAAASHAPGAVAAVPGGAMLGFFAGSMGGGAAGASMASPPRYRKRAAKGGAIGGVLGPLGSAGGAYLATENDREIKRKKNRLLRRK